MANNVSLDKCLAFIEQRKREGQVVSIYHVINTITFLNFEELEELHKGLKELTITGVEMNTRFILVNTQIEEHIKYYKLNIGLLS